jgi:pyruvate/2-oxoglutarate dehydrogenase complex dihydrolipoamide dehydrogenase (E3) component
VAERFDVAVVGMGPGGEAAAGRLMAGGKRVAVIEGELIGGECGYWACIPSKTLLRGTEARAGAGRVAGLSRPALAWPELRDYRDYMIRHLDDARQVTGYEKQGATVVKGTARLAGPGRVEAAGRNIEADHVVVATGSEPVRPPIEGLGDVPVWTNREATTVRDIPGRVVMLGGSAAGVELAQFYARMGAEVTVVEMAGRLIPREEPRVGELAAAALRADGAGVLTGRRAVRARRDGGGAVVGLDDGAEIPADVVVLATGRTPRTRDLGLEAAGVHPGERGAIPVDEHCRAGERLWAVGDVTGVAMFTHVAMYQGRVVADAILGRPRPARYGGIPRVIFADPEIAAVGLTARQAHEQGIDVASTEIDLAGSLARPWTYERDPRGSLGLLADRQRQVLVGAWAVAPLAGEWIHQAALAIRAGIPLDVLADQVAQFPTYSEGYLQAVEQLRG